MSGEVERQWARFNIVIIEGDRFNGHQHEEIHGLDFNEDDILVLYDVSALFTNVSLEETIQILANKAFTRNWLNETHNLNITQDDLVELL